MKQKSQALVKTLTNLLERCRKKQIIYQATLKDSKNKEQYKIYGDLITGNLYRIKQGASVAVVENYYEEDLPTVRIALDPQLSPTKNAQRYYKKYTKAKHAEEMAQKQMESNTEELLYLESVLFMLEEATSAADLAQIRQELEDGGYIASGQKKGKKAPKQQKGLPPMELEFEGYTIYIGRNNVQNDYLTLKLARANDLWLHVKHFPGSHVIVKSKGEDFPERVIEYAAKQAALHSKTEARSKTEIDYTLVKNVKKPNGAKPGMVIYEHYKTAVIDPAE